MKNNILFLIIVLIFSGCGILIVPRKIRNNINYCYDGNYNGIDTLINIKGYYMMYKPIMKDNYNGYHFVNSTPDTMRWYCIFFDDGMFKYSYNMIMNYGDWGRFKISGDTIKARFIESPGGTSLYEGEVWFKILYDYRVSVTFIL